MLGFNFKSDKGVDDGDTLTVMSEDDQRASLVDAIQNITSIPLLQELRSGLIGIRFDRRTESVDGYKESIMKGISEFRDSDKIASVDIDDKNLALNILRDAVYIKKLGLECFVGICMGESRRGGWAYDTTGETDKTFKNMTSFTEYTNMRAKYERFKTRRRSEIASLKSRGFEHLDPEILELSSTLNLTPIDIDNIKQFKANLNIFFKKYKWASNDKTIFGLLKKYAEYISDNKGKINREFKSIFIKLFGSERIRTREFEYICGLSNMGSETCKIMFCFAFYYCVRLNQLESSGGGPSQSRFNPDQQIVRVNAGNYSYWTKIFMLTFAIMFFIYHTLVLFETFRLLNATITRILDARVTYLALFNGEPEQDTTFIGYMNSFLNVMYESVAGNIIETLNELTPQVFKDMENSLRTVAATATNDAFNSCADGVFSCINTFLSGDLQQQIRDQSQALAMQEIDLMFLRKKYEIQEKLNKLKYAWRFGSRNLSTSLHGVSFSVILILHVFFPDSYTREMVATSAGSVVASYNINPLYGLYGVTGQLSILMCPVFSGWRRRIAPPQAQGNWGVIRPRLDALLVALDANIADVQAVVVREPSRGGKKRKTFKKKSNKTVKQKYKKRKTNKKYHK